MIKTPIAVALLSLATPFAAHAGPAKGTPLRVSYADLNLASAAGVAALDGRIDRAVRMVCSDSNRRVLGTVIEVERCRNATRHGVADQRNEAIAAARAGRIQVASGR